MCNLYRPPKVEQLALEFSTDTLDQVYGSTVAPLKPGPIVRRKAKAEIGQWGLIPPFSPSKRPSTKDGKPLSTNNARVEKIATAPSYKQAWLTGQRCLIPALDYDEPYYESIDPKEKCIWWRFARADGKPWALAGIWSEWKDYSTGEIVLSYTMLTQNCDAHPILKFMHKYDHKFAADKQDKRAVVPIARENWDQWLTGTVEEAWSLIQLPDASLFKHGPADPSRQVQLPVMAAAA